MSGYKGQVEKYKFSSLNDYIIGTNSFEILEISFLNQILKLGNKKNKKAYIELVKKCKSENDSIDVEFEKLKMYIKIERRIIPRHHTGEQVIETVVKYLKTEYT